MSDQYEAQTFGTVTVAEPVEVVQPLTSIDMTTTYSMQDLALAVNALSDKMKMMEQDFINFKKDCDENFRNIVFFVGELYSSLNVAMPTKNGRKLTSNRNPHDEIGRKYMLDERGRIIEGENGNVG